MFIILKILICNVFCDIVISTGLGRRIVYRDAYWLLKCSACGSDQWSQRVQAVPQGRSRRVQSVRRHIRAQVERHATHRTTLESTPLFRAGRPSTESMRADEECRRSSSTTSVNLATCLPSFGLQLNQIKYMN